jgi:hypothetical protein
MNRDFIKQKTTLPMSAGEVKFPLLSPFPRSYWLCKTPNINFPLPSQNLSIGINHILRILFKMPKPIKQEPNFSYIFNFSILNFREVRE